MTFSSRRNSRISKQRGFWLRYFLGGVIWMLLCLAAVGSMSAQVDIPGPERLTHVEGIVVNPAGHPAADLGITLVRDDKVAYQAKTDKSGEFRFEHVPAGPYLFRVERSKDAPAERQIVVTDEIVTVLERKKLYVILGPGACQDACSAILTSKKDFDRAIRKNNRH
jgi:Carboxypeptidase regulatory-like domain